MFGGEPVRATAVVRHVPLNSVCANTCFVCFATALQSISALQPSGEVMVLDITPRVDRQGAEAADRRSGTGDDLTRKTSGVEVVVGDQLLAEARVLDAGIAGETVSVVFKPNRVTYSNKEELHSLGRH